jgi:hypothetical protein
MIKTRESGAEPLTVKKNGRNRVVVIRRKPGVPLAGDARFPSSIFINSFMRLRVYGFSRSSNPVWVDSRRIYSVEARNGSIAQSFPSIFAGMIVPIFSRFSRRGCG